MIKKLFTISALTVSSLVSAQEFTVSSVWGLNYSNAIDTEETYSSFLGWHLGANVNYDVNENFVLRSGLIFSKQGFKDNFTQEGIEYKGKYKSNTIKIPLQASYYIDNRFGVSLGVNGFLVVDEKFHTKKPINLKVKSDFENTFYLGGEVNISYRLQNENKTEIYAGYNHGLTDVFKNDSNHTKINFFTLGLRGKLF